MFSAGVGLFREVAPRRFALTSLGAGLRADIPGSVRPMTLMLLDEVHWPAWGQLLHSMRTGETAFAHVHGAAFFDYLDRYPDTGAVFQRAMTSSTAGSGTAITEAYDFSGIRRLIEPERSPSPRRPRTRGGPRSGGSIAWCCRGPCPTRCPPPRTGPHSAPSTPPGASHLL